MNLNSDLCIKTKSPKVLCHKCQNYCPKGAIQISKAIIIDEKCDGCGICAVVCPTGVFIFNGNKRISPSTDTLKRERTFYCSHVADSQGKKWSGALPPQIVPCLGAISDLFILRFIFSERNPLVLVKGDCEVCKTKKGWEVFLQTKEKVFRYLEFLGLSKELLVIRNYEGEDSIQLDYIYTEFCLAIEDKLKLTRRDLFRSVKDRVTDLREKLFSWGGVEELDMTKRDRFSPNNLDELKECLKNDKGLSTLLGNFTELNITDDCCGCGACTNLCPTEALRRVDTDNKREIFFTPAKCFGCGLCYDICPSKSIKMSIMKNLSSFYEDSLLKTFFMLSYPDCNHIIYSLDEDKGGICPICTRRSELFLGLV